MPDHEVSAVASFRMTDENWDIWDQIDLLVYVWASMTDSAEDQENFAKVVNGVMEMGKENDEERYRTTFLKGLARLREKRDAR